MAAIEREREEVVVERLAEVVQRLRRGSMLWMLEGMGSCN